MLRQAATHYPDALHRGTHGPNAPVPFQSLDYWPIWSTRGQSGRRATGSLLPMIGQELQVLVRDNNVDQALRVLKKKMQREGIFREMKARRSYEKPSERRNREEAEAVRRARKAARKQAVREGLIAAPKKKEIVRRPSSGAPARPSESTPT